MTDTKTRTFMGMNIMGDIAKARSGSTPQRPKEEFAPYIEALFAFPEVAGLKWTQYTPYFNDGDPCEFRTGELCLLLTEDLENTDVDEDDLDDDDYNNTDGRLWLTSYNDKFKKLIGGSKYVYETTGSNARVRAETVVNAPLYEAWKALAGAMSSFQHAVLNLFGDHATVSVMKGQNIQVEFFEHD